MNERNAHRSRRDDTYIEEFYAIVAGAYVAGASAAHCIDDDGV